MSDRIIFGATGLEVSPISFGTWQLSPRFWGDQSKQDVLAAMDAALDGGINFFDTANIYGRGRSERYIGEWLQDKEREDFVIASKVFFPMGEKPNLGGLSRVHIMQAIDDSLRRLGMDYIDLYQIHRWDPDTPIEETLEALHDVVKSGKVRYIGASSMYAWQFSKSLYLADLHGWTRFVSMQNHYNLVYREEEREMIPFCRSEGIGIIPWSPLARGFLSGNRSSQDWGETTRAKSDEFAHDMYYQESDFTVVEHVVELAKEREVTPSQIALAWLLHQPGVTAPIIGASKMLHLEEDVAALDIELSEEELQILEEPYQPHPVLGHR